MPKQERDKVEGKSPGNTTLRLVSPRAVKRFKLTLKHGGKPLPGLAYSLRIGRALIEGRSTDAGLVEVDVPESVSTGTLSLDTPSGTRVFELHFGALEPASHPEGLRQRLSNLGFAASTEAADPKKVVLAAAAHCFALAQGPSASADPKSSAFKSALVEAYGS